MENQRLKELAGLTTANRSTSTKSWAVPANFTDLSEDQIVETLLAAPGGASKAVARVIAITEKKKDKMSKDDCDKMDKVKEKLKKKFDVAQEEAASYCRRAGLIFEKKKAEDEEPEMEMDDEAGKGGDDEEESLPKIVKKIAKKAVGKDVEELEDLIMKVYNAGHKDGEKAAKEDVGEKVDEAFGLNLGSKSASRKPNLSSGSNDKVKPEMTKAAKDAALKAKSKNPFEEAELTEKHHVKKGKKVTKVGTKADCEAHADEHGGEVIKGAPMTEEELAERHHVKKAGKVVKKGSKKECSDWADKNGGEVCKGDEMTEEELQEKHHVKKKGKVVKKGTKKDCMDWCDKNGGQVCKGDPDEMMDEELEDLDLETAIEEDTAQIQAAMSKVKDSRVGKPCMTPKGKGVVTGIVKQPKAGADGKAGPYVHSVTVRMGDNTVHTMPANQVKLFKGKTPSGPMLPKSVSSTAINNADKHVVAKGGKESGTKPTGKSMWKA